MVYLIFAFDETGWNLWGRALTARDAWRDMVAIAAFGMAARVVKRPQEEPAVYWG